MSAEVIALLREAIRRLEVTTALPGRPTHTKVAAKPATIGSASDAELDGKFGDPVIRKDPPRWQGSSYEGRKYSATTPEYLDSLAGLLEWKASKNEAEGDPARAKFIAFDRRDARLARGWARRLRARGTTATPAPTAEQGGFDADDDIPF
jgi:hypothetical protein